MAYEIQTWYTGEVRHCEVTIVTWVTVNITTRRGRGHVVAAALQAAQLVMTPPLIGGGIKR